MSAVLFFPFQAFSPIATVARKIIEKNGFSDKITVVGSRSTDVTNGMDKLSLVYIQFVFDVLTVR